MDSTGSCLGGGGSVSAHIFCMARSSSDSSLLSKEEDLDSSTSWAMLLEVVDELSVLLDGDSDVIFGGGA